MKAAITILIMVTIAGGIILLPSKGSSGNSNVPANNVTVVDGKQIIEIEARGGYRPRVSTAKAGLPTIIRFRSTSFDCSSFISIPSLNINKPLTQNGNTDVDAGTPQPGKLQGTCGMGMYRFTINFEA